jgi:hypothetical protein
MAWNIDTKWKLGCLAFLLFLINSWAQGRSQCFSAKVVLVPVIILPPKKRTAEPHRKDHSPNEDSYLS